MSAPEPERLVTLVLKVGSEPISGRIVDGEPFTGWVQLAAALDALSRDDTDVAPARVAPPG